MDMDARWSQHPAYEGGTYMKRNPATLRRHGLALAALGLLTTGFADAADLTLYANDDYQGRAVAVIIDERQLAVRNFDDRASSLVIDAGSWRLCSGEEFTGKCVTLEPGRYPSLSALGLDDDVTSVRRANPGSIGVFSDAGARSQAANTDASTVAMQSNSGATATQHVAAASSASTGAARETAPASAIVANTGAGSSSAAPRVVIRKDREAEVVFGDGRCAVYYDAGGQRWSQRAACDDAKVKQADEVMANYRRERNLGDSN
jgi:hypothetical protein